MSGPENPPSELNLLMAAGLPPDVVSAWNHAAPKLTGSYPQDRDRFSDYWLRSAHLVSQLPPVDRRSEREEAAGARIVEAARRTRTQFLRDHVVRVYNALTADGHRHIRVEELVMA